MGAGRRAAHPGAPPRRVGRRPSNPSPPSCAAVSTAAAFTRAWPLGRWLPRRRAPDVILSCDCIFAGLFDAGFLLLDVLSEVASSATTILLGFERRPGDDAERFFALAEQRGFRTTLRTRCQRVIVCEMRLVR